MHRDLGALLPTGSTVFVASSMPVRDLETFLPEQRPRRCASSPTGARTASTGQLNGIRRVPTLPFFMRAKSVDAKVVCG